jgi:hypothetical protein
MGSMNCVGYIFCGETSYGRNGGWDITFDTIFKICCEDVNCTELACGLV